MRMGLCVATMKDGLLPGDVATATETAVGPLPVHIRRNTPGDNLGVVKSYQWLYERSDEEILCCLHDDVVIHEQGWNERILKEFDDPTVGLVGLGGAKWHGTTDLYKRPYHLPNLRRGHYISNTDDAEAHGARFTAETDVAVLDGFSLVIRRSLLDRIGGFGLLVKNGIDFIAYDYAICALARRYGYRIRTVGVRCHHRGGGTSVGLNADRQEEYDRSHRWFYEEFRDVMPVIVK